MALSQGLVCTKRVYLGLGKVASIEGCPALCREVVLFQCVNKSTFGLSFVGRFVLGILNWRFHCTCSSMSILDLGKCEQVSFI